MMNFSNTESVIDADKDALTHRLQENFRQILEAYSRPGTAIRLPHLDSQASMQFMINLLDESVSFCDHHQLLDAQQRRFLQARQAQVADAQFIYLDGQNQPEVEFQPNLGSLSEPELGCTLVIEVSDLVEHLDTTSNCSVLSLAGPGIQGKTSIKVKGLHPEWLVRRAQWLSHFPLGLEMVLCTQDKLLVLTRTTQVTIVESEAWHM